MNRTLAAVILVSTLQILWSAELRALDVADKSKEYVACMDATLTSTRERTAPVAGSICFGMPGDALRSDIAHAG